MLLAFGLSLLGLLAACSSAADRGGAPVSVNTPPAASPADASPPVASPAGEPSSPAEPAGARKSYDAPPPVGDVKSYEKMQAVIETPRGNIIIKFYPKEAPRTVASFVFLAKEGFYNGLTFHRVEPGFVVQGGDPNGDGSGGPGYTLPAEFNAHKHVPGSVAMARTNDPDSAGSQFYIVTGDASFLDGKYTVFGEVTKGMDAVQKIQVGDPMLKVKIEPLK